MRRRSSGSVFTKTTAASQGWTKSAPEPPPAPATARAVLQRPPVLSSSKRAELKGSEKVLSSEERELQEAAAQIEKAKATNAQRRAQLDKVLSTAGTRVPKRSTAELTMPEEFELMTARSDPGTPKRNKPAAPTLGEQVHNFSKTPRRFRSRAPNAAPSPMPKATDPRSFTRSQSFDLLSSTRARPTSVKSTAEREAEEMAAMPKFKAQPLNKKVLESAGDLGVPRVQRPAPTQFAEFALSTTNSTKTSSAPNSKTSLTSSASEPQVGFKARPFKKHLMEGRAHGLAQVTPRKATTPRSPHLHTEMRARPYVAPEEETFAAFKALPMPTYSPQRSPRPNQQAAAEPRPITSPRPFALASEDRHAAALEERERRLKAAEEKEAAARVVHARPMPIGEAWAPVVGAKPATTPRPFELHSEMRGEIKETARQAALEQQAKEEKAQREFHARSADVLKKSSFAPAKSNRPLTEINGFGFSASIDATEKRKVREATQQAERAQKVRDERAAALQKQKSDAAELHKLRASLVHKARPATVLKKEPFKPSLGSARTTQAKSPAFAPSRARAVRA